MLVKLFPVSFYRNCFHSYSQQLNQDINIRQNSVINMECQPEPRIYLLSVPHEILEKIWTDACLSCRDICNLAAVCTLFRQISNSNEVWRIKFAQRFFTLF